MNAPDGITEWLILIGSCVFVVLLPYGLIRHWRDSENKGAWTATAMWYKQDRYRRGHHRATPAVVLAGWSVFAFILVAMFVIPPVPIGQVNLPLSWAAVGLAVALIISVIWYWLVMLFNKPQFLVAPHLRDQPGLLKDK